MWFFVFVGCFLFFVFFVGLYEPGDTFGGRSQNGGSQSWEGVLGYNIAFL
jgi:hypothetical protein